MKGVSIVGIHTGIGKTIASAVITEALEADYWKPVQSGSIEGTDAATVRSLITNSHTHIHPEAYLLREPLSPHAAARLEEQEVSLERLQLPESKRPIVVETAGGLLSPLNDTQTNLDLVVQLALPVILVSRHYLGSINHTMLTVKVLQQAGLPVSCILFNGEPNPETEQFILQNTGIPYLANMPEFAMLNRQLIGDFARDIRTNLSSLLA